MIKNWSYSKYNTYCQCPRKIKYRYVDGLPDPAGPAADRGTRIHKLAEDYVTRQLEHFPVELVLFSKQLRYLRRIRATAEQEWALNSNWEQVPWDAPDMWCRGKVDCTYRTKEGVQIVIDYKTGKVRPEHESQLSFYALLSFLVFPEVNEVGTMLWYLDHGTETAKTYKRSQVEHLKRHWAEVTHSLLTDTEFPTNPSPLCNYCAFSRKKGGPCEF